MKNHLFVIVDITKENERNRFYAEWENVTHERIQKNELYRKFQELKIKQRERLEQRRNT